MNPPRFFAAGFCNLLALSIVFYMKGLSININEGSLMRLETQALAEIYRDRLFAAAFQVCGNAADAEDAAQEALLR